MKEKKALTFWLLRRWRVNKRLISDFLWPTNNLRNVFQVTTTCLDKVMLMLSSSVCSKGLNSWHFISGAFTFVLCRFLTLIWCGTRLKFFCLLVGALSLVNHKGLYQGWKSTSVYLLITLLASFNKTTKFLFITTFLCNKNISLTTVMYENTCFWACLFSLGTQHRNLHQ